MGCCFFRKLKETSESLLLQLLIGLEETSKRKLAFDWNELCALCARYEVILGQFVPLRNATLLIYLNHHRPTTTTIDN